MKCQQKSDIKCLIFITDVLKVWQLYFCYRSGLCITEASTAVYEKLCSSLRSSYFHLYFQRFRHICLKKKKRAPKLVSYCLLPVPQELDNQSGTLGQVKERARIKAHCFNFIICQEFKLEKLFSYLGQDMWSGTGAPFGRM